MTEQPDNRPLDLDTGMLAANARSYRPHPILDRIADAIEAGDSDLLNRMPPSVRDEGQIHRDFRDSYRAAVAAGVIPDDRPSAA